MLSGEEVDAEKITILLAERGALKQTAEAAGRLVEEALAALQSVDDNRFTAGLRGVAEYLKALIRRVVV